MYVYKAFNVFPAMTSFRVPPFWSFGYVRRSRHIAGSLSDRTSQATKVTKEANPMTEIMHFNPIIGSSIVSIHNWDYITQMLKLTMPSRIWSTVKCFWISVSGGWFKSREKRAAFHSWSSIYAWGRQQLECRREHPKKDKNSGRSRISVNLVKKALHTTQK